MPQDTGQILPLFLNMDGSYKELKPEESPFSKGLVWEMNANPGTEGGMNNPSGEGQNVFSLTPARSNKIFSKVESLLPEGYNKNVGSFEHPLLKELYYMNYNSNGNHGIYQIDGNTGAVQKVIVDPKLAFSNDQKAFIKTRAAIRFYKDADGNVVEKSLLWTDGRKWHGWINVLAAIGSQGFDSGLYPYWITRPPHFDREELLEWAVRPPMQAPTVTAIANTSADTGNVNRVIDKAFRFAIAREYTDGRLTRLSPYSLPFYLKSEDYVNNLENAPKKATIKFDAGSSMTEKIKIYVQEGVSGDVLDPIAAWGDWKLYDTIEKFDTDSDGNYWERQNPWSNNNYDITLNTIEYTFDNSKSGTLVSQEDVRMLHTAMPQLSQAMADIDDSLLLCNNRYGYDNLAKSVLNKISTTVKEKEAEVCTRETRTIYLYAYIGQCYPDFSYTSQFAYRNGDDQQVRFGGVRMTAAGGQVSVNFDESEFFKLDFADRESLRVYLKGTSYYADGECVIVRSDNTIEEISEIYDMSTVDAKTLVQNILEAGSYFAFRFKLTVPAGRYIATLARHNVSSSQDYKNTSTYIYGIANSRVKSETEIRVGGFSKTLTSIKPNAIDGYYSKEMEIDCVNGDVDVWGNNADLFYVYAPYYQYSSGQGRYRFIEGYLKEEADNPLPVERFPYILNHSNTDDCGYFTDKNGFYWGYTKAADSANTNIEVRAKINCGYPTIFVIAASSSGTGWKINADAYLSTYNGGVVGDCNRIIITGSVRDLTNTIPYSNIAVSIKDGPTVFTRTDGTFTMVIHNGSNTLRTSNIYFNSPGNYFITTANCGQIPLTQFNELNVPCNNCQLREYPFPINLLIDIQSSISVTSLKQGGKYSIGCVLGDLAGRLTYVNIANDVSVQTFLQRDNVNATYFQVALSGTLQLASQNPDFKWFAFYVSRNANTKRPVQWVGDSIIYLDNDGNTVTDSSNASFVKILIQSLYDYNVSKNFTLLAKYQFVKGDRVRVYDDGDGNLFDTATYGDTIDVQVLGTDYNQAAINAGLLPPETNTFLDNTSEAEGIGLIMKYDSRFDRLKNKTGFWIELYSPSKTEDVIPFFEVSSFYPIINGEIAEFVGYSGSQPQYNFPQSFNLNFWDTYYLQRTILGKYYSHPFESPNITDDWGSNMISGGRIQVENKDAAQYWDGGDVIKSGGYGLLNELAMFREKERTSYGEYPYGEIVAAITKRNTIAFICTNDWFVVEYNMPYARVSNNQVVIANLDESLSFPKPKGGPMYGLAKEDIGTVVFDDDFFYWLDLKNTGFIRCDYNSAIDVTKTVGNEKGGLQSYLNKKLQFVNSWNASHETKDRFDAVCGLDMERGNIYLTFRPRRNNSTEATSFSSNRRFQDTGYQETFVYSTKYMGWMPCANFAPEAYASLRGAWANVEMISFASGNPYYHNNTPNDSFLNYYGVQTEPVITAVANKDKEVVKILQALSQIINGSSFFFDQIYSTQPNSFSYIPPSFIKEKEKVFYSEVLRDMSSYPGIDPNELYRSMLHDGKRLFAEYFVIRMVQKYADLGKYFQLSSLNYLIANSHTTKP